MDSLISKLKQRVTELASSEEFIHHEWFVEWHLKIVERIALELCDYYQSADRNLVTVISWMHDYGKIVDFNNQYEASQKQGKQQLLAIGFDKDFSEKVISYIDILDKKLELDISKAPLEVQIVSSADGCSHMVGPFLNLWWYENPKRSYAQLMQDNLKKLEKDWTRKIVLPEARSAYFARYEVLRQLSGELPDRLIKITED